MNLFALTELENEETIYRIPLSQDVQVEVDNLFTQLSTNFFNNKDEIQFDGNYNASSDELFVIDNYPMHMDIINAAFNALNYTILDIRNLNGKIKAIFATHQNNGQNQYYFQGFDTSKIIANKGIPLFNNNGVYTRFVNRGIVILSNLTAVYKLNNVYFNSYFNAKKIIDLTEYYQEATNDEVEIFSNQELFNFANRQAFTQNLSSYQRKKIKSIHLRGLLQGLNVNDLQQKANQFGIQFTFNNGKLVIPNDSSYIKKMLKFLDEDYFITPLTNRRCVTNSKRELN